MDRIVIKNDETWGRLVKSWATGERHLKNGYVPPHTPRSLEELSQQCANAMRPNNHINPDGSVKENAPRAENDLIVVPASIVGLTVMQYSEKVLALRLPPQKMVKAAHDEIENGADYILPEFYKEAFGVPFTLTDKEKRLKFHAERIGDYSIRNCG